MPIQQKNRPHIRCEDGVLTNYLTIYETSPEQWGYDKYKSNFVNNKKIYIFTALTYYIGLYAIEKAEDSQSQPFFIKKNT